MGLFDNLLGKVSSDFTKYSGDAAFLSAAASASALVVNADGQIDDAEINAALKGLSGNAKLAAAYKPSQIEEELNTALNDSKSRAGKIKLTRALEADATRPLEQRQDILLVAADVADLGGIGDKEKEALTEIGKLINIDGAKLLGL